MSSTIIPIVIGSVVGIAFIIALAFMIGNSGSSTKAFNPTSGWRTFTIELGSDSVDGCCGPSEPITFDHELILGGPEN